MSRLIPVEITELKNLQQLWLSVNYLSGGLPETIGHMESLGNYFAWLVFAWIRWHVFLTLLLYHKMQQKASLFGEMRT